jgi:predicted dehydrogenase
VTFSANNQILISGNLPACFIKMIRKMKKIKWGIIGCGDVTEVKSGPAFQKANNSELVAVMRRDGELARDYASRHNVPRWYDNADQLINDPEVNAVYIATPPSSHNEYTLKVAAAGKAVYVEKPMAMNRDECEQMVDACKIEGVPLFVAYYRRALPRFLKVKSIIDSGEIGKIISFRSNFLRPMLDVDKNAGENWRVDPKIAGCGYLCDMGSHAIDLLQFFISPIHDVRAFTAKSTNLYEVEDIISASFQTDNGIVGSAYWNFNAGYVLDQTEIMGTKGYVRYACFANEPVVLYSEGEERKFDIAHPEHIQQPLIQTIVDELLGKGKCISTGETGLLTNSVIDKIKE